MKPSSFSWSSSNINSFKDISISLSKNSFQNLTFLCTTTVFYLEFLFSTIDSNFISSSLLFVGRKRTCGYLIKACYIEGKKFRRQTSYLWLDHQNRQITKAMEFFGLWENHSYTSGPTIFRGYFIKVITWNFNNKSHFDNNKYNPISRRVEPKFKVFHSFLQSILQILVQSYFRKMRETH